jgi:hypothetical protein
VPHEEERHSGRGPIVGHDGLLASIEDGRTPPATFDILYPPEIRERVLAPAAIHRRHGVLAIKTHEV